MAWQVDPVVTETANGEVITDFTVSGDRPGLHRGFDPNWQNDLSVDNQGQTHHVFENVELNDDPDYNIFDTDDYADSVVAAYPDLPSALAWGEENLPADRIDAYNNAVDSDDPAEFMPLIEKLLEDFRDSNGEPVAEEQEGEPLEEFEPPTDEEVDTVIDELYEQEPQGEEVAQEWQAVAQQAKAQGNETYAGVAAATAAFQAGEVTAEEAIQFCMDNYDRDELAKVVRYIRG